MTPDQRQFCEDVGKAMAIWDEYHPDDELTDAQMERQEITIKEYEEVTKNPTSTKNQKDFAELKYYRTMNNILKEVSGIGIKELPGTGDPIADFDRAIKIIE